MIVRTARSQMAVEFYGKPQCVADMPPVKCYGQDFRQEILSMHQDICDKGLWVQMAKEPPQDSGFLYNETPWLVDLVSDQNGRVHGDGHSGATQAYCLRNLQFVARNGWKAYVNTCARN